ncbi:sensor histidine kinase [Clostridium tertium]|uniref:sensor histidine kinase n=1 Tax=Clostridium tertium TaxID=1559 RepID=UPI00291B6C79|nr:sensor histidine kinase [Clostridium sp.]
MERYTIKPSASIISTIGSEIIKDPFAAIIELVKNAYDADAENVQIVFRQYIDSDKNPYLNIIVKDDGHGMSPDIVKTAWLVPATKNKYIKKKSPSGRYYLGRKGIGRYASSILGDKFNLVSIDKSSIETSLSLNWSDFNRYEFLQDVPIEINERQTQNSSGTKINIINKNLDNSMWNENSFFKLIKELKLLVSPLQDIDINDNSKLPFNIYLTIDIPHNPHNCDNIKIEPFDLQNFYNYRLFGKISKNGLVDLTYENTCEKVIQREHINDILPIPTEDSSYSYCGDIYIDFRVFDRDPSDIQNISEKSKSLFDKFYLGKLQTRQLLNEISGIKLYRNNFRIRPYGEIENDWLNLDKERVQNPSFKIGNNQICGQVVISSEEESNLIESSSREGLKENSSYKGLIYILKNTINRIESRRFSYRKNSGKGRSVKKVSEIIDNLPDFNQLTYDIDSIIKSNKSTDDKSNKVIEIISQVEVKAKQTINDLQDIIAIYQGQATLGKIIMVVLHEGRRPIQWLNNHVNRIEKYIPLLKSNPNNDIILNNILSTLHDNVDYTKMISDLFERIEPLSIKSKKKKQIFNLSAEIKKSINIFESELKKDDILIDFDDINITINGYAEDIVSTFTNLIENSIYWLNTLNNPNKKISIDIHENTDYVEILYKDNGPGIKKEFIENQIIFDPQFTTKNKGTGIGLAICGESIIRNNGSIKAIYSETGALFIIKIEKEKIL